MGMGLSDSEADHESGNQSVDQVSNPSQTQLEELRVHQAKIKKEEKNVKGEAW